MRNFNIFALCLTFTTGCVPQAQVVAPQPTELAVTKVVLYQNGVGYFERRGKIVGDHIELRVRPDQINDVLKSLTVLDLAGGMPSSVSLPVERSGDRQAAELPPQVRNAAGMQGLLAVLRGAEVEVDGADGVLAGRVVGVEMGTRKSSSVMEADKTTTEAILTLMNGENNLLTTAVSGIKRVTIGDRTLAVGLQRSLDISKSDGAWKPVSLTVRLAGDESHDLIISYIHEVPIWRPAYRAWVEQGKGAQLQGWAIVDNVSGEAWNNVALTLVVGSPLSFRYNLHTPHNVLRADLSSRQAQVAEAPPESDVGAEGGEASPPPAPAMEPQPEKESAAGPGGGGGGAGRFGAMKKSKSARPSGKGASKADMADDVDGDSSGYDRRREPAPMAKAEESTRREAMMRSAAALVQGKEVGALYTYEAQAPVTVPDRSAALINIVSRKIDGTDVFLFREPYSGQSPFRAVLLRNGKESALEGGPITLYIDGTFAGEGFIGRVAKDETAFVAYAKETGFALHITADQKIDELHLLKIVDGKITVQGKRVSTRTIKLESNRDKDSVAYVKLALTSGTQLVDPPKDMVKSGNDVFFPVFVKAKSKGEAKLVEATPVQFVEGGLTSNVLDAFRFYLKGQTLDQAVAGPIKELLALNDDMAKIQQDSYNLEQQREILDRENQRIQGNLDSLPQGQVAADLRRKLVAQLDGVTRKSAEVAKKLVENQVKLAALQEKLRVLLLQISLK